MQKAAAAVGVLAALVVAGCVGTPSREELASQTVVITQRAPGIDFASYKTFAITDTIPLSTDLDGGPDTTTVDPAIANPTLDAIAGELTARGYQRVDRTQRPDLGVAVSAVIRVNAAVFYGVWWGVGPSTGAFWGLNNATLTTAINSAGVPLWASGALVTELYDLRSARNAAAASGQLLVAAVDGGANVPLQVVWASFIYGVVAAPGVSPKGPPIAGVHQAFVQSPYLRTP